MKQAFTLAEVLLTLGIVGVVASMTLPMLAENYQKIIIQTRLKKFYTTFNQAILRSVDVNGPYDGWFYLVNHSYGDDGKQISKTEQISSSFELYLAPYLSIELRRKVIYTNQSSNTLYYLSDGSAFMYNYTQNRDIYYYPKAPDKCLKRNYKERAGRCEFLFNFVPSPSIANDPAWNYLKNRGLEPYKYNWDGNPAKLYNTSQGCNNDKGGALCTAIIQYNDWQIPQDYPREIRY